PRRGKHRGSCISRRLIFGPAPQLLPCVHETVGGGPSRNRTGVQGFAVLCVTTPPSGRGEAALWRERPLPVNPLPTIWTVSRNGGWLGSPRSIRASLISRCIIGI